MIAGRRDEDPVVHVVEREPRPDLRCGFWLPSAHAPCWRRPGHAGGNGGGHRSRWALEYQAECAARRYRAVLAVIQAARAVRHRCRSCIVIVPPGRDKCHGCEGRLDGPLTLAMIAAMLESRAWLA